MRPSRSLQIRKHQTEKQGNRFKPVDQGFNSKTSEQEQKDAHTPGDVYPKEVKVSQRATAKTLQRRLVARCAPTSRSVSSDTRGRKRRAEPKPETPNKRRRDSSKQEAVTSVKPAKVSQEASNLRQRKRKADTETDSSRKRRRVSESICSSSSSEKEPEASVFQVNTSTDDFEAKYKKLDKIGEGGCGCVYEGIRIADSLPVAIKCIAAAYVDNEIEMKQIPLEVSLMQRAAGGPESFGKHAAVSLLDWYYLDQELVIVMERPLSAVNLTEYVFKNGSFDESKAKNFMAQMVDAAIDLNNKGVFHRDFKFANILVEDGPVPRYRIVDFGCGSFVDGKYFRDYSGTFALAPSEWVIHQRYRAEPATVWQLGALLYRMLHRRFFNVMSFLKGELPINTTHSPDCIDFLQKCLAMEHQRASLEQLRLHPWLQ